MSLLSFNKSFKMLFIDYLVSMYTARSLFSPRQFVSAVHQCQAQAALWPPQHYNCLHFVSWLLFCLILISFFFCCFFNKVNKKLAEQQGELPQDQVDLQQFIAPTPLPPPPTPQQFIPPPTPQQPLLQSEVPDMAVLGAETLESAQLAAMVPTPAPTAAPLLAPPTPGVPPPTPGLPPTTPGLVPPATPMPTPLPMDVEMPQLPPDQVGFCIYCDCLLVPSGWIWLVYVIALTPAVLLSFSAHCLLYSWPSPSPPLWQSDVMSEAFLHKFMNLPSH